MKTYEDKYKEGNPVRTMMGRYGECILISDLQQILLRDAVRMQRDGQVVAAAYAETMAENLGKLRRV